MGEVKTYRCNAISIAKGIAIILMVVGHSSAPDWLHYWIYSFHMPLFFILSGYCFSEKWLDKPVDFVKRKLKTIYWPYVKYSLLFLLFHNVLAYLHVYDGHYSLYWFFRQAGFIVLTMTGNDGMLGGYWFLPALLFASIIGWVLIRCKSAKLGGVALLLIALVSRRYGVEIKAPSIDGTTALATVFFLVGYMLKRKDLFSRKWYVYLMTFMLVGIVAQFQKSGMLGVQGTWLFCYVACATIATISMMYFSQWLMNYERPRQFLGFVGNETLTVLTWHFLSMKVMSYVIIQIYGLPIERMADFPVLTEYAHQGWWVAYAAVGCVLPLGITCSLNKAIY